MKPMHIVIISQSPIISNGLEQIIGGINPTPNVTISADLTKATKFITGTSPVVIADPLALSKTDAENLIRRCHLIAIACGPIPHDVTTRFDGCISLYDTPDRIKSLICEITKNDAPTEDDSSRELTPREKEVVIGIVKGMSNKEIATSINVSVNTVTTHRRNIAAKLQIHSPAGLTIYAIVKKLVDISELKV